MNEKSCGFEINGLNPFTPESAKWHLRILLCLTPDDFSRQWRMPWE